MQPLKILTVIGARPQFVKAAVVTRNFMLQGDTFEEILVHTGQHYDVNMSQVFFDELAIPVPKYNLGIGGGTHGQNTGRMLEKLEELMLLEKPQWVLVYGDTDSTLAGALAAAKLHISLAHVEGGMRSFNKRMPEEQNRVLTDHLSTRLFVSTNVARDNLLRESIQLSKIEIVGDVMYDAMIYFRSKAFKPLWFDLHGIQNSGFNLCTIHRAENTQSIARMTEIFKGLARSVLPIVFPLHPRTRSALAKMNLKIPSNVIAVDPVGFLEMVWLEMNCELIITDSGGVQKEAYFNRKPCLTLRDETEWVELVSCGANRLVGADSTLIEEGLAVQWPRDSVPHLYGDGSAGEKIVGNFVQSCGH